MSTFLDHTGALFPPLAFLTHGNSILNSLGTPFKLSYGLDDLVLHRGIAANDVFSFGGKIVNEGASGSASVLSERAQVAFGGFVERQAGFTAVADGQGTLTYTQNDTTGDSIQVAGVGGSDLQVKAGVGTLGTGHPVTGLGFRPVAVLFQQNPAAGGTGTSIGAGYAWGFATESFQGSAANAVVNQGTNYRYQRTGQCLVTVNAFGAASQISRVSLDADGFTTSGTPMSGTWIAFGGCRAAAGVGIQPGVPGQQRVVTGLTNRLAILVSVGAPANTLVDSPIASWSQGMSDGVRQNGYWTGEARVGNGAPMLGAKNLRDDRVLMFGTFNGASSTVDAEATMDGFDPVELSFILDWLTVDGIGREYLWLVLGDAPEPPPPPSPDSPGSSLVLDVKAKRWFFDQYVSAVTARLWEPGEQVHGAQLGHVGGEVSAWGEPGDFGQAIPWLIQAPDFDGGDARREKVFGDLFVSADPQGSTNGLTVTPGINGFSGVLPSTIIGAGEAGRNSYIVDVQSGYGRLAKNLGLQISGTDLVRPIVFLWEPAVLPKVETTRLRATDWDTAGRIGAKFMQGVRIIADTEGLAVPVRIEYDGGQLGASLTVNENGEDVAPLSFPTPFMAHMVRIVPTDLTKTWRFYVAEWVWEPAPDLVAVWETQPTTLDLPGYHHEERALVGYISTTDAQLIITYDDVSFTYALPNSDGAYVKLEILEAPNKSKVSSYRIETLSGLPGIRVFQRDLEIRVKAWGSSGPYQSFRPFGDESRISGARI